MVVMEIVKGTQKVTVEYFNTAWQAKQQAIRLAGYAGWLKFIQDSDGDLSAENDQFRVDITRL